ncbi:hypothetical protein [Halobacillus kuroshimensis]|uniref:hypothetical protein n=1 Tax=Halobacillus kuroshimensis TaxID=302481 RepID=UPI000420D3DC|nr:hypothetical protein [Halobacillus kuroshimensis]
MEHIKFMKIAESLRQYRRAELRDFEDEIGVDPVDKIYMDPLPGDAVLHSVLSSNTTFLLGRKGTGKSTIFTKAQLSMRDKKNIITTYLDVKSLYDMIPTQQTSNEVSANDNISETAFRSHMLRKSMLGQVISELLKKINVSCENLSIWERWTGKKKRYEELRSSLEKIQEEVKTPKLESNELPILQRITTQIRTKNQTENAKTTSEKLGGKGSVKTTGSGSIEASAESSLTDFDKSLDDHEIYNEYSDVVYKSFPFSEIITEIQTLLSECGLSKLVIFLDDFSELSFVDQRLFVDVILSPLNNSSNEAIKLKVAGYPGRVYYGKIDPNKIDTINLDFSDLYESTEVQEMERSAMNYTMGLLETRFNLFEVDIEDYFDCSSNSMDEYYRLLFQASFNVPRIIGHLLHFCYIDRISKGSKINLQAIRLASRKYFEQTVHLYFDKLNRFALEPFENKLDRYNQKELLGTLISEAKETRKRIMGDELGGTYFQGISNPPTSHFIVTPNLNEFFASLESNFLLSKYKNTRNKDGQQVTVYALFYGLVESERFQWGYPPGREYRNYFVQRCFDYTRAVHNYLSNNQTIECNNCGTCYSLDKRESFEMYHWKCPECAVGDCRVVYIADNFKEEFTQLDEDIMLETIEVEILSVLNSEERKMRAGEISHLIDSTHQMVGKRTSKLQELGLIEKGKKDINGKTYNEITELAKRIYFS